ncbi:ATP-dependent RNA helicase DHX8/PRP22 [Mytilus galloprovincialis]|uniref:ATP-dependent RNA helicase DHX8/PRP22 n=1 Tax=Mytilus galloprovincialis TaxID=29158 RepID=A0A8B6F0I5_MYTGA|nr:ATP-dependent RNA helicase DHX8/PRP22 [Mytilus galloprovincialis]
MSSNARTNVSAASSSAAIEGEAVKHAHAEQNQRNKPKEKQSISKMKKQAVCLKASGCHLTDTELKARLKYITKEDLVVTYIRYDDKDTVFALEIKSSNLAKKIVSSIHNKNKDTDIKISVFNEKQIKIKYEHTNFFQDKQNELKKVMDSEAENVLSNHNKMIDNVLQKINTVSKNFESEYQAFNIEKEELDVSLECKNSKSCSDETSVLSYRSKQEIDALQDKLSELKLQKNEFEDFLKSMNELEKLKSSKEIDSAMHLAYSQFQIECKHLANALPMYARRGEIISTVTENQVSIIIGETGSGKSTQVTQYLYQAGLADSGLIVCTQPRKIAATSLATRVATELNTSVGHLVGYHVGMQIKTSHKTRIVYMTDQMLLHLCLKDEKFSKYACIIIDEAHERSIYTDLLLGMIKKSLNKRPELRVIITSATIEPEIFVNYFGTCPVLNISGRMFPVDVIWPTENDEDYENAALQKTISVHEKEQIGDILTFLTSPNEIEKCCNSFEKALQDKSKFICLPLHGRLQPQEQQKVFDPSPEGKRKIVFATNSAETSITIPGIRYVIDSGVAKEMQYDPKKNISTLSVTNITKSSAEQRKGRAGRTEPGKCYRLYTENTYEKMEANTKPEILRVHLGQALLKLYELGVNPLEFDFVQKPTQQLLDTAVETLELVGAVSENRITDLGKWIAKLQIDPKFGAFLYEAIEEGFGIEAIVLTSCCGTSGMFYRSESESQKSIADKNKIQFCHEGGDFMTMLNVFREWHNQNEKSKSRWCSQNSINKKVLRGIRETVNEILSVLKKEHGIHLRFQMQPPTDVDDKLHKMLFNVFRQNICHFLGHDKAGYLDIHKDQIVQIFPASSLKPLGLQPDWIVLERVLKTSRDFATNITPVKDMWIDDALTNGSLTFDLLSIKSQRVELAVFCEVGEKVFSNFVGSRFSELRNIEKAIRQATGGSFITVEASKEMGEISAYTAAKNKETAKYMIIDRLKSIKDLLKSETKEHYLSPSNKGVKVVIGPGMDIADVLMPNEFKTVIVEVKSKSVSDQEIRQHFEKIGNVVNVQKFRYNREKTKWGRVTFQRKEDAALSVETTKGKDIRAIPDTEITFNKIQNSHCTMRAKIEWCRRPPFALIRFNDTSYVRKACKTTISCGGRTLRIRTNKTDASEIHVTNFGLETKEADLRTAFIGALFISNDAIAKVTLRKKTVKTSENELILLKQTLESKLSQYVREGKYNLDLKLPKESFDKFLAFVSFTLHEEGNAAYVGIHNSFKINYETVTMSPEFKSSVVVQKRIYEVYAKLLGTFYEKLQSLNVNCLPAKELTKGNMLIELRSGDYVNVLKGKTIIEKIIEGQKFDRDNIEWTEKLFTLNSRRYVESIGKQTNTIIMIDARVSSVIIHGTEDAKSIATEMLLDYIKELITGVSKQINLKGPDRPAGVMKELMLRYGYDLDTLLVKSGVRFLELDRQRHILIITGKSEAVDIVNEHIQNVIDEISDRKTKEVSQLCNTRDCALCLCEIEDDNIYRLELCGHPYCKQCVILLIDASSFPLCCSRENCGETVALHDIMRITENKENLVNRLVEKTTSSFVEKNHLSFKYCTTPECQTIYRITQNENLFTCPLCDLHICTSCHRNFHPGLTCIGAQLKVEDKEADTLYSLWVKQNKNVKPCPKCHVLIEKNGGCSHIAYVSINHLVHTNSRLIGQALELDLQNTKTGKTMSSTVKTNASTEIGSERTHNKTHNSHTEQQQRKKSKVEKINSKIKHKNLYLKVTGSHHTDADLKARFKHITKEDLVVEHTRRDGEDTVFTIQLRSSKLAKKIISSIHKENKNTEGKIFIIDQQQKDVKEQPSFLQNNKIKLKELVDKEACEVVSNHNKMIREVQRRIKNVTEKLGRDSHEYNEEEEDMDVVPGGEKSQTNSIEASIISHRAKQEIDALQDKLTELKLQKKEFKDFITCMDEMLKET